MDDLYVLGMTLGHNATAALTYNGHVLACASEERFVRVKNVYGYPAQAVNYCLQQAGLTPVELDYVVLSSHITPPLHHTIDGLREASPDEGSGWFTFLSKVRHRLGHVAPLEQASYRRVAPLLAKMTHKKRVRVLSSLLGIPEEKFLSSEHHLTHAYSVVFSSPFVHQPPEDDRVLVITVDGEGDMLSSSVGVFVPSTLHYHRIAQSSYAESLGHFYSSVTTYLGMKMLEHEYKVMGLAPYAFSEQAEALYQQLRRYLWIDDDLRIRTKVHSHHFGELLHDIFRGVRFDYVAAASQKIVETLLVELVKKSVAKTKISSVALAGGVFMNVKANYEILRLPEIKRLYVMPSCGDESLPIGSCYYGTWLHRRSCLSTLPALSHVYLGPEYSHEQIENALAHSSFAFTDHGKRINVEVSRLLAEGEVVARFDGRMEFGARALGNRSILADASNIDIVDIINRMIKKRDFWMPFAPSIMVEYAEAYIAHPELLKKTDASFMMVAFESTPLARQDLKAALHQYDKTLRPHLVHESVNPRYYDLLKTFMKRTGRYGFLNTSFNIHGEPIVCSPDDALHTLQESGLQYLAIGDFLVSK